MIVAFIQQAIAVGSVVLQKNSFGKKLENRPCSKVTIEGFKSGKTVIGYSNSRKPAKI